MPDIGSITIILNHKKALLLTVKKALPFLNIKSS